MTSGTAIRYSELWHYPSEPWYAYRDFCGKNSSKYLDSETCDMLYMHIYAVFDPLRCSFWDVMDWDQEALMYMDTYVFQVSTPHPPKAKAKAARQRSKKMMRARLYNQQRDYEWLAVDTCVEEPVFDLGEILRPESLQLAGAVHGDQLFDADAEPHTVCLGAGGQGWRLETNIKRCESFGFLPNWCFVRHNAEACEWAACGTVCDSKSASAAVSVRIVSRFCHASSSRQYSWGNGRRSCGGSSAATFSHKDFFWRSAERRGILTNSRLGVISLTHNLHPLFSAPCQVSLVAQFLWTIGAEAGPMGHICEAAGGLLEQEGQALLFSTLLVETHLNSKCRGLRKDRSQAVKESDCLLTRSKIQSCAKTGEAMVVS